MTKLERIEAMKAFSEAFRNRQFHKITLGHIQAMCELVAYHFNAIVALENDDYPSEKTYKTLYHDDVLDPFWYVEITYPDGHIELPAGSYETSFDCHAAIDRMKARDRHD